jgi:hypothetical protein
MVQLQPGQNIDGGPVSSPHHGETGEQLPTEVDGEDGEEDEDVEDNGDNLLSPVSSEDDATDSEVDDPVLDIEDGELARLNKRRRNC